MPGQPMIWVPTPCSHMRAGVLCLMENLVGLLCRMASKNLRQMFAMECQYSSFHQNAKNVTCREKEMAWFGGVLPSDKVRQNDWVPNLVSLGMESVFEPTREPYLSLVTYFVGPYLLQYLTTSSVQMWRENAWEISSHVMMSGRQRVDTRPVVIINKLCIDQSRVSQVFWHWMWQHRVYETFFPIDNYCMVKQWYPPNPW